MFPDKIQLPRSAYDELDALLQWLEAAPLSVKLPSNIQEYFRQQAMNLMKFSPQYYEAHRFGCELHYEGEVIVKLFDYTKSRNYKIEVLL